MFSSFKMSPTVRGIVKKIRNLDYTLRGGGIIVLTECGKTVRIWDDLYSSLLPDIHMFVDNKGVHDCLSLREMWSLRCSVRYAVKSEKRRQAKRQRDILEGK